MKYIASLKSEREGVIVKLSIRGEEFNYIIRLNSSEIVDGDVILYLEDSKKVIVMNSTASSIWDELLMAHTNNKDICDEQIAKTIMKKYGLDNTMHTKIIDDISVIIDRFINESLLIIE